LKGTASKGKQSTEEGGNGWVEELQSAADERSVERGREEGGKKVQADLEPELWQARRKGQEDWGLQLGVIQ